ncbi:NAD(P)-dependent dehydrogenase (short-subunit alcohol dehydrogenase family) [Paraburkholderia sp. BL27I4N3]|uniref:SDR family NAD(P)-dependent oxidoreductase n=1 Tax=Paraburkholderia sp. BL27I4N3 TaxID=1938805 RepID=UPI000E279FDE|nr:SDR family NAD(P)-dependent oxidoreductase [Paraburkholderia sp. BL27I4N3]REE18152.1 NAD(P)-dependent dehydrogenase (short-subunit alcohol dehydrogenase family) [Paraburkholderia sp. BL27I4N3]
MFDLSGRVAVITGGETGIGLAISRTLAKSGAKVVIGGILVEEGERAASEIKAEGGDVYFVKTDVRIEAEVERLVAEAVSRFGKLDIMINNAGVFDGFASCLETTTALWDQIIDINLKGCFFGCKAALKQLLSQGSGGRIINTSSVGGLRGAADGASYTAAKFGVVGLTRQIACDYSEQGITVNAICPGSIQTDVRKNSGTILGADTVPMNRGVGADPEAWKRTIPARRRGLPQEVADVAVFLASDAASYMSGQAIAIDGGWTAT